ATGGRSVTSARLGTRGAAAADALANRFLAGRTFTRQRAGVAVWIFRPAVIAGHGADQLDEGRPARLRYEVLQARPHRLGVVLVHQAEPLHRAQRRLVERDGVAPQGLLNHPGADIIVGRLVARQLLRRLFQALLVQPFQVERKGRLEHLLQEADEALGAQLAVGHAGEGFFQLADRADAHLVPVEEAAAQVAERLVGLLGGGPFPADPVDELLEDGTGFAVGGFRLAAEDVGKLVQQALFVSCRGHSLIFTPSSGWRWRARRRDARVGR